MGRYSRIEVTDGVTIMNKELYDNLQDGLDSTISNIRSLASVNDTFQRNFEVLQPKIESLESKTSSLEEEVTAQGEVDTEQGETIAEQGESIAALNLRVGQVESDIASLEDADNTLLENILSVQEESNTKHSMSIDAIEEVNDRLDNEFKDIECPKKGTTPVNFVNIASSTPFMVTNLGRNMLKATGETNTHNGVTYTNNGDGTYTVNGTATGGNSFFRVGIIHNLKGKRIRLLGSPNTTSGIGSLIKLVDADNTSNYQYIAETFTGNTIALCPYDDAYIEIFVFEGRTASNELVKPMVTTYFSATYDDFVPYGDTEVKVVGNNLAKSILLENANVTVRGITATRKGDGTYLLNGTNDGTDHSYREVTQKFDIPNVDSIKISCFAENSGVRFILNAYDESGAYLRGVLSTSSKDVVLNITARRQSYPDEKKYCLYWEVPLGATVNNVVFYPFITTDTTSTYLDYYKYNEKVLTIAGDEELPVSNLQLKKGLNHIISEVYTVVKYPTTDDNIQMVELVNNVAHKVEDMEESIPEESAVKTFVMWSGNSFSVPELGITNQTAFRDCIRAMMVYSKSNNIQVDLTCLLSANSNDTAIYNGISTEFSPNYTSLSQVFIRCFDGVASVEIFSSINKSMAVGYYRWDGVANSEMSFNGPTFLSRDAEVFISSSTPSEAKMDLSKTLWVQP